MPDNPNPTSELAQAVQEVSERASLLVREEIELAKAEMTEKVTKLLKGAVVGIVGGIFAVFALVYLLHSLSWGIFAAVLTTTRTTSGSATWSSAASCCCSAGSAGFLATRFMKSGSPPTPAMAIEEAQLIKQTIETSRPAKPIGAGGSVEPSEPRAAAEAKR